MTRPIKPSTGTACSQCQCHGNSPRTAGAKIMASAAPIERSTAEPPERERIQFQPISPSQSGRRNTMIPKACSRMSLSVAPVTPIQLRTSAASPAEAVFNDGSVGWYVASARNRRIDTSVTTMPRNTFRARLRVGDRMIGIGFIEGDASALAAAIGWNRQGGREIPEQPLLSALQSWDSGQNTAGEPE